jgi:hypothetical protein
VRTHYKTLLLLLVAVPFAFTPPNHQITGKWEIPLPDGSSSGEFVLLKSDGTYTVSLPDGKIGERGFYKLQHGVFALRNAVDHACGANYWGKYKLDFHGEDSVHLTLIEDSCSARRMDVVGYNPGLRRVRK